MNAWLESFDLVLLKSLLVALALPPVPMLVLVLAGAGALRWHPRAGWASLLTGVAGIWFACTPAGADWVTESLLSPPLPVRSPQTLVDPPPPLGRSVIVVLGGGRTAYVEYPEVSLNLISLERLRYAIWLGRETRTPVYFSGGRGPGSVEGPSEAEAAMRIARDEFGFEIDGSEARSRNTRENAAFTTAALAKAGIGRVILVTHALHMPRALAHFVRARDNANLDHEIVAAPVGVTEQGAESVFGDYLPSPDGIARFRYAVREWLGILAGA